MKIAIVGLGVSGAALLRSLEVTGKLDENVKVDIFDPKDEPAVGLAYGKDSKHLLLNAFPTAMSLNPENKYEFSEWLKIHYPKYDAKVDLVPRQVFGEYAKECLAPLLEKENVRHYQKEIIDVVLEEDSSKSYILKDLKNQRYGNYDYLFFAVGNPPYNDFYQLNDHENYIKDPYPVVEKLEKVKEDTKVAIIGSSLTAFDLVNYLSHEKNLKHPLGIFTVVPYFNSLRVTPYQGPALSYSLDSHWVQEKIREHDGNIPLDNIVKTIQKDLKANAIDLPTIRKQYDPADLKGTYQAYFNQEHPELSKLQAYISLLSGNLGDLYMSLSKEDQLNYQLKYAPLFSHYQVRLAPDAVKNMYQLMTGEDLFIVHDLKEINKTNPFTLKSQAGESYKADLIINATGFDFNTNHMDGDNSLVKNLLNKGFLLDKDHSGILVTWPESQVINQQYGQLNRCFFIGPWVSNTHYANNNVNALVKKAYDIIKNHMNH
ncbi:MAG: FAD/NAD(P)-binding protein [Atopostipes suicloacalis]|nr:FAD/NAD(P)-binding protein [Atopostipes suicloacalis]